MTGKPSTRTNADSAPDVPHDAAIADVLVVGAGPTGLLLAGDLAARGLSVTVVERRPRSDEQHDARLRRSCPHPRSSSTPAASPTSCSRRAPASPGCGSSATFRSTSPDCGPASRSC